MKVEANSIDELIDNSSKANLMVEIKQLIESHTSQKAVFVDTAWANMIGYYFFYYKNSTFRDDLWPIISIASQKNYVSLYIFLQKDGKYFLEHYSDNFKKSEIGKSCLRIKELNETNEDIITEIICDAISYIESNYEIIDVE